jgi:aspartate kinase
MNGHSDASNPLLKNASHGAWIVQKYGGTSVGKFAVNIAEDIIR